MKAANIPTQLVTLKVLYDLGPNTNNLTIQQSISVGQFIDIPFNKSIKDVRIITTEGDGWVAWNRVLFITGETCECAEP